MTDESKEGKNIYWSNLTKQGLLNATYMIMAFSMCIQGPTLLDLQEIYETSLERISLGLTAVGTGAMVGCLAFGYVWTRLHSRRYLVVFVLLSVLSTSVALLPHAGNVWVFLAVNVVVGGFLACMHAAINILCLEIWQGLNGAPYMHSMHFFNSVGSFLAPVVSRYFLSSRIYDEDDDVDNHTNVNNTFTKDNNNSSTTYDGDAPSSDTSITLLYPMTGLVMLLLSFGFFYFDIKGRKQNTYNLNDPTKTTTQPPPTFILTASKKLLLSLIVVFVVTVFALQFSILMYLPAFAVKCFHKSKVDGANLLTIHLVPYAAARAVSVFVAMKLNPVQLLTCNLSLMLCGTALFIIAGDRHWVLTQVGFGVAGFGLGSTFASTFMWIKCYVPLTGVVAAWVNIGVGLGQNLAMVVGLFMDHEPLFLVYFLAGMIVMAVILFVLALWVGRKVLGENEVEKEEELKKELSAN